MKTFQDNNASLPLRIMEKDFKTNYNKRKGCSRIRLIAEVNKVNKYVEMKNAHFYFFALNNFVIKLIVQRLQRVLD